MLKPVNTFLLGAMKAGTTTLADLLAQHPDICLSSPKEPHFFTEKEGLDLDWYHARFAQPERRIRIDASTSYTIAPVEVGIPFKRVCEKYRGIPEKIHRYNPEAKFIYVLREPVSRTYSHYNHNARDGWEKRPFMQAIHEDAQYLSASHYLQQLEAYWAFFPKEAFLLLPFEEIMKSPADAARRCCDFLGLPPPPVMEETRAKNVGFVYNPIGQKLHKLGLMELASRLLPDAVKQWLAPLVSRGIPPMSPQDRQELARHFQPHNQRLQESTGFDTSGWTRNTQ
ncbi:MAG: sulfotransferase [Pseudomonadota bacterium]